MIEVEEKLNLYEVEYVYPALGKAVVSTMYVASMSMFSALNLVNDWFETRTALVNARVMNVKLIEDTLIVEKL